MTERTGYTRNPYWVLGLSVHATSRDIRRRFDELKIAVDLGMEPGLTEDDLREARQGLDDPAKRIVNQWFWFLGDEVPAGYAAMLQGVAFRNADATRQASGPHNDGLVEALRQHDAMTAELIALQLNPSGLKGLSQLFQNAKVAGSNPRLWGFLATLGDAKDDPRIAAEIERFRRTANDEFVARALAALSSVDLQDEHLKEVLAALAESGSSARTITTATKRLLDQREDVVIAAIQRFDRDWEALDLESIGDSPLPWQRTGLQRLISFGRDQFIPQALALRSVAPGTWQPEFFDQIAQRLGSLAIAALQVAEDGWQALVLCDSALGIVGTSQERADISEVRVTLEHQVCQLELMRALEAKDWSLAVAYAEELRSRKSPDSATLTTLIQNITRQWSVAPANVDNARKQLRQRLQNPGASMLRRASPASTQAARPPSSQPALPPVLPPAARVATTPRRRIWPWVVGAVVGGGVLLNVLSGGRSADPPARTVRATATVRAGSSGQATSPPNCRSQLAALEATIDRLAPQIDYVQATMTAEEQIIAPHATEIAWIETNYPSMVLPPDLYDRYQYVVGQYNGGVDRLRQLDGEENRKIALYNDLVNDHNALLRSC